MPADIRSRYELTDGKQLELVVEGGVIRLLVRRRTREGEGGKEGGASGG